MNAFLLIQGLETLPFRMDGHVANAKAVASFLQSHSEVSWVNYAGLESSPHYELANKYMPKGPGAIFTFGVKGGLITRLAKYLILDWIDEKNLKISTRTEKIGGYKITWSGFFCRYTYHRYSFSSVQECEPLVE